MTASQIPLTLRAASGCSCYTPDDAASGPIEAVAAAPTAAAYGLLGLTCAGCASRVAARLKGLDGVLDVHITPVPGGISTATVTSSRPLAHTEVAGAVAQAGYALAEGRPYAAAPAPSCCSD